MEEAVFFSHPTVARFCRQAQIFRKCTSLTELKGMVAKLLYPTELEKFESETQEWLNEGKNHLTQFVSYYDNEYPPLLREIHDPPLALAYQGNLNLLQNCIFSIVGTRKPSPVSILATKFLIDKLQKKKEMQSEIAIASGMALGIDRIAFISALDQKIPVIGVLGTPLGILYPPGNRDLYDRMKDSSDSLLITEFATRSEPAKWTFPKRNRVISGLSWQVFIMESSEKSGTLWTAMGAVSQNRDLFVFDHPLQNNNLGGKSLLADGASPLEWEFLSEGRGKLYLSDDLRKKTWDEWEEDDRKKQEELLRCKAEALGQGNYWIPSF